MSLRGAMFGAMAMAAILATGRAEATIWTYTYTGNTFTTVNPPWTKLDAIDFKFSSPTLLGDNLVDAGFPGSVLSWSLSVGPLSYSSATPGSVLYSINFSTDASGKIIGYQFTTQTDTTAPGLLPPEYPPTPYEEEVFSFDLPALLGKADGIYIPSIFQDSYYTYNSGAPGTWTVTAAVPEPATWAVLLIGICGIGCVTRQRTGARWL